MMKATYLFPAAVALLCGTAWGVYLIGTSPTPFSRFQPGETLRMPNPPKEDAPSSGQGAKFTLREKVVLDQSQSPPRAVAIDATHNFGVMDPFSTAEHVFTIRNEGTSTLTLHAGPTTCKCTACVVRQPKVSPGSSAQVEVAWRTVGRQENFRHSATVYTNDPANPVIKLIIQGAVRTHIGAEPPDFTLPRVSPQDTTVARTVVYSQAWDSFSVDKFTSTIPGVTFKTLPASASDLKPFGAKSGHVIEVTLPAGLPSGVFKESVRFEVQHSETVEGKPIEFEIGMEGKVLRRLSIQGTGVFPDGTIQLDAVNPSTGVKKRFLMKLNDQQLELPVERIACSPDFVKVEVTPYMPEGKQMGLYYLDISIPANTPPTARLVDNPGTIEVDFDHPRAEDLRLKLQFIISPPE